MRLLSEIEAILSHCKMADKMLRVTTIESDEEIENFDSIEDEKQPVVSLLIYGSDYLCTGQVEHENQNHNKMAI